MFVLSGDSRLMTTFSANATARNGETLYFGTDSGLLCLSGEDQDRKLPPPPANRLIFSDLILMNASQRSIPLYSDGGDREVSLDHDENFFVVNFTVPSSVSSGQMQFEYRLEGLEEEWRRATSQRVAAYTNVPAGD